MPTRAEPVVNALTIDFEDWYMGLEIPPSQWDSFEDRMVGAGRRVLELLAEANVHATFFVLGIVAERHPEMVREIAAAGHEVGTHGYAHEFVYRLTPDIFREQLKRSMKAVEDLSGQAVIGHRAPYFSITKDSLWALEVMGELGIRYDSSVFPVHNYRYGIADAPRWPYPVDGAAQLMEFPISTWKVLRQNVPIAGGAYFRIFPYAVTRMGLRAINREGRAAVFYLHPWEVDPGHPRIKLPRRVALTHYHNLGGTEKRFRRLLRDFAFAPMKDVLHVG